MKAYDNKTALIKTVLKTVMDPPDGLKAKARDLLDSVSTGSYKELAEVSKPGGEISQILLCRKTEQEKLKRLGLHDK